MKTRKAASSAGLLRLTTINGKRVDNLPEEISLEKKRLKIAWCVVKGFCCGIFPLVALYVLYELYYWGFWHIDRMFGALRVG
jgi:hypothetical protein